MKKIFLLLIFAVFISACDKGGDTVTSPSGNSIIGAPTVTGITPTSGAPGATVTITGTDFSPTPANNTVFFNKTLAPVKNATTTSLNVSVPVGATSGAVSVITAGGVATSPTSFAVSAGGTTGGSTGGTTGGGTTGGGTGGTTGGGTTCSDPALIGNWLYSTPYVVQPVKFTSTTVSYGDSTCLMTYTYTACAGKVNETYLSTSGTKAGSYGCAIGTAGAETFSFTYSVSGSTLILDGVTYTKQ